MIPCNTLCVVSIDGKQAKVEAGIPLAATSFAFLHPLPYFRRRLTRINLARESWGFLFLLGGFAVPADGCQLVEGAATGHSQC